MWNGLEGYELVPDVRVRVYEGRWLVWDTAKPSDPTPSPGLFCRGPLPRLIMTSPFPSVVALVAQKIGYLVFLSSCNGDEVAAAASETSNILREQRATEPCYG